MRLQQKLTASKFKATLDSYKSNGLTVAVRGCLEFNTQTNGYALYLDFKDAQGSWRARFIGSRNKPRTTKSIASAVRMLLSLGITDFEIRGVPDDY